MYPQYPQIPYPYSSARVPSAAYVPDPAYAPQQQQHYYPQQYAPQPAVPSAAGVPPVRRLPIRDPFTGLVVPVVTSEQVEQAVETYHLTSKETDLVDLDLESLFLKCQADLPQILGLQDSTDFASNLLLNAARKGLPFSQYYVGRCFEQGKGIAGNQGQCMQWFQHASDQCIPEATYKLAQCCEDGWGCVTNLSKAVDLYKQAADAGVPAAQLRLGVMYENGIGVKTNFKAALESFIKAISLAEAQYHIGRCYDHGVGTVENKATAIKWYTQAKGKGFALASIRLQDLQLSAGKVAAQLNNSSNSEAGRCESPLGIPPQRSKPAVTKPDPKAKIFTPGVNGSQRGDSGLSRSESSGSGRPDPRARPFVPPPALAARLSKSDDWGTDDTGSARSDASGASGGLQPVNAVSEPQGKGGQLKAQAQAFQPMAQMVMNKQGSAQPFKLGKVPEAAVSDAASNEHKSSAQSALEAPTQSSAEQVEKKSPSKKAAKLPSKSPSKNTTQEPAKQAAAPVEDLDELHTLQMSKAWSMLEEATQADQQDISTIKAAICRARPYAELKDYVTGAESLLATLERAEGRASLALLARKQVTPSEPPQTAESNQEPHTGPQLDLSQPAKPEQVKSIHQVESIQLPESAQNAEPPQMPVTELPSQGESLLQSSISQPVALEPLTVTQEEPQQLQHGQMPGKADPSKQSPPKLEPSNQCIPPIDGDGVGASADQGSQAEAHEADQALTESAAGQPASIDAVPEAAPDSVLAAASQTPGDDQPTPSSADMEQQVDPVAHLTEAAGQAAIIQEAAEEAGTVQQAANKNDDAQEAAVEPATTSAPAAAPSSGPGSMQDFLSFLLPAEIPPTSSPAPSSSSVAPAKQAQPSRWASRPYSNTSRAPIAPYRPPGTSYDPTQAELAQSGNEGNQVPAHSLLQAGNSGCSDQAHPGLPHREQSSEDVLAEILGPGFSGTPSRPGRSAQESPVALRDAPRSPALSASSAPRYQPPLLSPERLKAEAAQPADQVGASDDAAAAEAASQTSALPTETAALELEAVVSAAETGGSEASASQADAPAEPASSSQQADQAQSDAHPDAQGISQAQSESSIQQEAEESGSQAKAGNKVRAVDTNYSVSASKGGRSKGQAKPAKEPSKVTADQEAGKAANHSMSRAASTSSQPEAPDAAVMLPPKPKPGAPKARKAQQPNSNEETEDLPQVQGPPPQQPPSQASALKQQSPQQPQAAQQPAPKQTQAERSGPQQHQATPQEHQAPSSGLYQPKPAAIPLPANSAWARKLDLQSALSSSPSLSSAAVPPPIRPTPKTSSSPPQPAQSSAAVSGPIFKPIPMPDRHSSAGSKAKGKAKKKGQGQAKQVPVAQPSSAAASSQSHPTVKEVPAKDKDSRPRASATTVLTAPGLAKNASSATGLQDAATQQPRNVRKEKEGALIAIMQDGMKVTANNRQAWIEICTCPLSLDIMTDPVVAADGITYEQADIAEWMSKSSKSPWTNQAFDTMDLTPNLLVLQLIQQFNLVESESD